MTRSPAQARADHKHGAARERQCMAALASRGIVVVPNRRLFRFGLSSYLPDLFDPATGVYYEVVGSRQRYHQALPKYDLMRHCFPEVTLRHVAPDGTPFPHRRQWRRAALSLEVASALIERGLRAKDLAALAGVSSGTLSQVMTGRRNSRAATELLRRVQAWVKNGEMPPRPPGLAEIACERRQDTRELALRVLAEIKARGVVKTEIARGLQVSPQRLNEVLLHSGGATLLPRIVAWLREHANGNGAGSVLSTA